MIEPCFCKRGPMSQCIADNYNEQLACVGFQKSDVAARCMHKNEDMNDHCWNPTAQSIGLRHAVPDIDDADTAEYELVDPGELIEEEVSCLNCMRYTCAYIDKELRMALPKSLTFDQLRGHASNCQGYERIT